MRPGCWSIFCCTQQQERAVFFSKLENGVEVSLIILGDLAYPLLPWLMYIDNAHTIADQGNFTTSKLG